MAKSVTHSFVVAAVFMLAATNTLIKAQLITVQNGNRSLESATHDSRRIVVPLRHGGDFLFAQVRVNDADLGWWLIHTADPGILIDTAIAQRLGLPEVEKVWGAGKDDPDASLVLLGKLQVGPVPAKPHLAAAMDLSEWRRYLGVDISGILGWGFLRDQPFAIDFRAGTLTLFSPGDAIAPAKPTFAGPLHLLTGVPSVPGNLDGRYSGWFKIDSAESSPLFLSAVFSALHTEAWSGRPLHAASRFGAMSLLGVSQPVVARWESKGRHLPEHPKLLSCGSIGAPFLRKMRITSDRSTDRLWAERLPDLPLDALLAQLGDPNGHDLAGVTPLMRVAAEGRTDAVAALLDQGADANAVDAFGRTPLMRACGAGNVATVKLLLAHGSRPDIAARSNGSTALIAAVTASDADAVQALLDAGAPADQLDLAGVTPLRSAVAGDDDRIVAMLLNRGANPTSAGRDGLSPFLAAAEWNATHALRVLLKRGIPPADPKTGRTLLMEAAQHNAAGAVRELIDAGADANARAADGKTALMEAAGSGSTDALRLLLSAGADPRLRSAEDEDACMYAFEGGKQWDAMLLYPLSHRVSPATSKPSTRPASVVIRAQRGGPYLFVPASIDGQQPIPMLLDTGAIGITIDKSLAEQLHLKTISPVDDPAKDTLVVEIPRLQVGGVSIGPTFAFVMDLSKVRNGLGIRGPFVVGMPFVDAPVRIDFPAAEVEVYERDAFRPPTAPCEFPLQTVRSAHLCLPAVLFGTDHVLAGLDTGSGSELDLTSVYALLHVDQLGPRLGFGSLQGATERVDAFKYRLNAAGVLGRAGEITAEVRLSDADDSWLRPPAEIGAGMLQRCTLWLEPAEGRGWAKCRSDNEPLDGFARRIGTDQNADLLHTTPLMRAVIEGRRDVVAALLKRGASPDEPDNAGWTPMLRACNRGDQAIADLLLDNRATATRADLQAAAASGLAEVVDRLLKGGVSARTEVVDEFLPLRWAAFSNSVPSIEALLAAGADPNERGPDGRTPLMACGMADCPDAAEALLKNHANTEVAAPDGRRALMLAAEQDKPKVAEVLLAHGAKVDAVDNDGKTALMHAAEHAGPEMVRMLLRAGANRSTKSNTGATALDYAAGPRHIRDAELLYFGLTKTP